eukprot:354017-Rhodomonas_salina.2
MLRRLSTPQPGTIAPARQYELLYEIRSRQYWHGYAHTLESVLAWVCRYTSASEKKLTNPDLCLYQKLDGVQLLVAPYSAH